MDGRRGLWAACGGGKRHHRGVRVPALPSARDPRFHSCNPAKPEAGFLRTSLPLSQTSKCGLLSDLEEVDIDRKLFPPTMVRGKDELE